MGFPNYPGIPPLRNSGEVAAAAALVAAPLLGDLLNAKAPTWGIYEPDSENLVIEPDSFISMEFSNQQNISNFPVEKGSFASYNKVQNPFSAIITVAKGGSDATRYEFLTKLDAMIQSLTLFRLRTPDKEYQNVSLERYDFARRQSNGVTLLTIDLHLVEIRQADVTTTPGSASSTSVPASAAPTVSNGQVSAQSTTTTGAPQ